MSAAALKSSVPVFAALGDETRLALVRRLCTRGPVPLTLLCEGAGVTRQGITKHLRVLEDAGLVRSKRDGRASLWELRACQAQRSPPERSTSSRREWDAALDRLRHMVED